MNQNLSHFHVLLPKFNKILLLKHITYNGNLLGLRFICISIITVGIIKKNNNNIIKCNKKFIFI